MTKFTPETIAAVDLGSNSFHMIVAQVNEHDELKQVDKLKEMVRLRGGLDENNNLSAEKQDVALACLRRFGERIRHLPVESVRIAGTNTLRTMQDATEFQALAKEALGHSVSIIAGREEARLIYLGVAHTLSDDDGKRFVMDIGGGSTEFIIGEKFKPLELESLNMGSVSVTQRFFADGSLKKENWDKAITALSLEITPIKSAYEIGHWNIATGASGTIKAARNIIHALELEKFGITLKSLHKVKDLMIEAGDIEQVDLPKLKADRKPVFAGGLAVLIAAFETLKIDSMTVSDGALREGLLYDLIGRIHHEDTRDNSINSLMKRFDIDLVQSQQVTTTADHLFKQVATEWELNKRYRKLLIWAAMIHELGLSIAHSNYHTHGAYILDNADLPGFSRKGQRWLSTLVDTHRRSINHANFERLPPQEQAIVKKLSVLLRLSVLFHRSRKNEHILPNIQLGENKMAIHCRELSNRPMLLADLKREKAWLENIAFTLNFENKQSTT
ncbi:MAG: Exopolyphosphatase (EC [uncultured Thiotrichaceae bacterium]|uniref:Exopolyphosphatase (EC) n=1 Tax=uncultured Thiotrichaceae bacterium TaxID=298394 RepID=A0A6S6TVR8_9GAMM|nr:MAG: Exopolyphosphatase (EC [uncultured Thiotrichaceae bacterium]